MQGDSRVHDLRLDRNGYARNSNGGYVKGGTSFEFSRLLTGEIARRLRRARLCRSAAAIACEGLLIIGLAGVDRDAADHGKILLRHHDRRRPRCPAPRAC